MTSILLIVRGLIVRSSRVSDTVTTVSNSYGIHDNVLVISNLLMDLGNSSCVLVSRRFHPC